jgi:HNH endonuclease
MFGLIAEKIRNNDSQWFKRFSACRGRAEDILIKHKTIITLLISALGSAKRLEGSRQVLDIIIDEAMAGNEDVDIDNIAEKIGLQTRLYSIRTKQGTNFSDDVKTSVFLKNALSSALKCPICAGYLDPSKSASYDHIERKQDGGLGAEDNCQLTHPYCNTSVKN